MNRRHFMSAGIGMGIMAGIPAQAAQDALGAQGGAGEAAERDALRARWIEMLGPFPEQPASPAPAIRQVEDIDGIPCYHVTFQSEPETGPTAGSRFAPLLQRVSAFLLVPESAKPGPSPAIVCVHSTTRGSGKSRIVGLSGGQPSDPPDPPETSRAYGLELARWGYVTLSIDLICDGERRAEGYHQHDTSWFYEAHPDWSAMGKNAWDTMRAVDFLETLDYVDPKRIGCVGHSLGGQTTLFTAAFDERVACAVPNCGVLSWRRDTDHWARPAERKDGVDGYVYIPRFRPYVLDPAKPVPVDFEHLMMLVAPRPLLIQCTEDEARMDDTVNKMALASERYRALGAGDRFSLFTFPGDHNFPPVAKRMAFAWLDRWLDHTPAIPTIWPGTAV